MSQIPGDPNSNLPTDLIETIDHTIAPSTPGPGPSVPPTTSPDPSLDDEPQFPDVPAEPAAGPPAPSAEAPATPSGVLEMLRAQGYDPAGFETDQAAFDYLLAQTAAAQQQTQQIAEMQQMAQYGQQMLPHAEQFQNFLTAQQEQVQQEQTRQQAEEEAYWQSLPDWDSTKEQFLRRGENGALEVVPGGDPALVPQYRKYADQYKRNLQQLANDPYSCIEPRIAQREKALLDQVDQRIQQATAAHQQQLSTNQVVQQFVAQNQDWLYQFDDQGQRVADPNSGTPVLSPAGVAYVHAVQQLSAAGTTPNQIMPMALRMVAGSLPQPPAESPAAPQPAAPAPTPEAHKDRFLTNALRQARHTPNRDNTVSTAAQPHAPAQNAEDDPEVMMSQFAQQHGLTDHVS